MTYKKLYEDALFKLEHNKITLGEYEEMTKPLDREVEQETRKGHWIGRKKVGFGEWKDVTVLVNLKGRVTDSCECSECGDWLTGSDEYECSARYCPNCGAKMKSEVEDDTD